MSKARAIIAAVCGAAFLCLALLLGCGKGGLGIPTDPPAVLYVYDTDTALANDFETFLDTVAVCDTEHITDLSELTLSVYDVIIVGDDTGSPPDVWGDPGDLAALIGSGKPVLGVGRGGSIYFGAVGGLGIDYGSCWTALSLGTVDVVSGSHYIWNVPNDLAAATDDTLTLFVTGTENAYAAYVPSPGTVELLGRQPGNADHYTIARDGRNVLWGYQRSAGDFSPDARALFYNIIQYLRAL